MKTCTGCRQSKPLEGFHRQKTGAGGRASRCKECAAAGRAALHARWAAERAENPVTEKQCGACKETLPAQCFYPALCNRTGLASKCIDCDAKRRKTYYASNVPKFRENARNWKKVNPERARVSMRNARLRREYGVSQQRYEEMLAGQGGRCAICRTDEPGITRNKDLKIFRIDHDHNCCPGKRSCGACVRGLLCNRCNSGIGMLNDDPDVVMAAAAYLLTVREQKIASLTI